MRNVQATSLTEGRLAYTLKLLIINSKGQRAFTLAYYIIINDILLHHTDLD